MAGLAAIGMIANSGRSIYEAFVFSTEWCVFLVLLMALYNVVVFLMERIRDSILLWMVLFIMHILIRFVAIYTNTDPEKQGVLGQSPRLIYDSFIFSVEWSIFSVLLLAIYNLVSLILKHMQDAITVWMLIFVVHLMLRIVYMQSSNDNWWWWTQ